MKKKLLYFLYSLLFFLPTALHAQIANHVVMSQVFGGGGNTGAPWNNDFVELYNPTSSDITMTNWSIQYSSAAGTAWGSSIASPATIASFTGIIKAHGYFLIQLAAGTTVTTKPFTITADATGPVNMSATAGKVALVNNSTQISQVANPTDASIVDLIGYYTAASATVTTGFETAYLTIPSTVTANTWSAHRIANASSTATSLLTGGADATAGNGWDSNNNSTDFVVQTTVIPRNSATPVAPALGASTPTLTTSVSSLDFGATTAVGGSATKTFTVSGANLTAGATLTVTGAGYTVSTDGTTFGATATIAAAFTAAQTITVKFSPTGTTAATGSIAITSTGAATQTVTLTGTGAAATPTLTTSVSSLDFGSTTTVGGSATKTFTVSGANLTAGATLTVTAAGYTVSTDGATFGATATIAAAFTAAQTITVKFSPTGTTAATGSIAITSTGAATQTVTLTGTGAAAVAGLANHVVISQLYGANGNVYPYDFIELYNPTSADVDMSAWSLQYNSATGTAAFSGLTAFSAGTIIKAHSYFLVQEQGTAGTGTATAPTADLTTTATTNNFNMSGTAGKIALVNNQTILGLPPTLPSTPIIDFVGYGTTAAYYEGTAAAPAPSTTTSIMRKASATSTPTTMAAGGSEANAGNGYDTDNNGNDFFVPTTITLRNSATPAAPSLGVSTPTLTTSVSSLDFGTTTLVGGSATKTFTVSGANLTAGATLTVTGAGYTVSTDGTTFGATATIAAAFTAAQTITVKFSPTGTTAATGSIAITSTGAATQTVTLTGTGASATTPALTTSVSSLDFGTATAIGSSATKTFTVSGANLTAGATLTVTGAGYTVSTDGTTFGATATIAAAFTAAQTITVKFTPTVTTAATGSIAITSTGAATQTVTLTGTGVSTANTPPTLNAIADQAVCYTATPQVIALSGITPGNEATQSLIISISSSNAALFSSIGVFPISGGTTGQIIYAIAPGASGTALVTVTLKDNGGTANGGVDTYVRTFNITVNALPNVNIVSNVGTTITKGVTAQLTATAGGTTYAWSPAADIISGAGTAVVTVRPKATETFTVVVTNATGCSTTQTVTLNVGTFFPLVTSNILTPNGDGKNDTWIIKNIDYYPTSTVKVVDKAGKVVFTTTNYLNDWAGTYNGQPLTQGTYYYVIDLGSGAPKYTGYITLLRD